MTKVIADISMSLDGFVTGPDPDLEQGLGRGGEPLHAWAFSDNATDAAQLRAGTERSGAVVMGRRLFDIIDSPHGWDYEVGYGAREAGSPPFFVVTHAVPATRRLEPSSRSLRPLRGATESHHRRRVGAIERRLRCASAYVYVRRRIRSKPRRALPDRLVRQCVLL